MSQTVPQESQAPSSASIVAHIDISIIIPVKNCVKLLETLLKSIVENMPEHVRFEIIVADDGSDVDLEPVCRDYGAVMLRSETSAGPACARNRGARKAAGDILLFMDADVVCASGVIERVKSELDRDPDLYAVSFLNQPYDADATTAANYGAAIEHYWYTSLFDRDNELVDVKGMATRNGAVRRTAFEAVGGFDVSFKTNAMEDYDFGKRLTARYRAAMARTPVVYHNFPTSIGRLFRNYFVRTYLFVPYYLKNRPPFDKIQTSPTEAGLRMIGSFACVFLAVAVIGIPPSPLWLIATVVCIGAYLYGVHEFLKAARRWSNSMTFAVQAFLIHYMSTLAISCGGILGLFLYGRDRWLASDRSESR